MSGTAVSEATATPVGARATPAGPAPHREAPGRPIAHRTGDAALAERVVLLRRRADAAEAAYLDALREFDERDVAVRTAGLGTRSWLRDRLQLAPARTGRDLRVAQVMQRWPDIGDAARTGEVSATHVGVIADAATHLGDQIMSDTVSQVVAAARVTDPQLLRAGLRSVTGAVDSPRADRAARRSRHDRWLDIDPTFEGTVSINGILDAESGALVRTVLEPLARRTGPEDDRAPTVRRADALAEATRRLLDIGELPVTAGQRPHLTMTVAVETLTRMGAERARTTTAPRTADPTVVPATGAADAVEPRAADAHGLPAELADATVLSGDALRQLACDTVITRIVLDRDAVPIELGRTARLVSPGQRRALLLRDHGCRYPGCDRPHQWTDAHHIEHWIDGGQTDLTNLISLCRTHHRMLHDGEYQIRPGPGNTFLIVPARGAPITSRPNATATSIARQILTPPPREQPASPEPAARERPASPEPAARGRSLRRGPAPPGPARHLPDPRLPGPARLASTGPEP